MGIVWIIFINLSFVLWLLGFADMCKIRTKLAYGNDMYVLTNVTIFEQILKIGNTTRPHNMLRQGINTTDKVLSIM